MPELPESQNDQDATFSGGQTAAELTDEYEKSQSRPSAVEDEDTLLELADRLKEGNYPPEELAKIRVGLAERGLLTDDINHESPKGALTNALVWAEERAAEANPTEASPAEPQPAVERPTLTKGAQRLEQQRMKRVIDPDDMSENQRIWDRTVYLDNTDPDVVEGALQAQGQAESTAAMDRLTKAYGITKDATSETDTTTKPPTEIAEEPTNNLKVTNKRTWDRNPQTEPESVTTQPEITAPQDAKADPNPFKTFLDTTRARGRKLDGPQPPNPDGAPTPPTGAYSPDDIRRAELARDLGVASAAESVPDSLRQSVIDQDRRQFEANIAETRGPKTDKMHDEAIIENFEHNIRNSMRSERPSGVLERLQRLPQERNGRKAERAERERLSELQREHQERKETRGPLTAEDVEAAYAANIDNKLAASDAKAGRIESARAKLEQAHLESEAAVQRYRDAKDSIPGQVDQIKTDISNMLKGANLSNGEAVVNRDVALGESAELNVRLLEELRQRIGVSGDPIMTRRMVPVEDEIAAAMEDQKKPHKQRAEGVPVTELIYATTEDPKLIYSERWSEDGQLVSARLVTTEKPAFQERKQMKRLKRLTRRESINTMRPTHEAIAALDVAGAEDEVPQPQDFSDTRELTSLGDRAKRKFKPVTQQLESYGMDANTINYITGRKKAKGRVRRRGVLSTLRGN